MDLEKKFMRFSRPTLFLTRESRDIFLHLSTTARSIGLRNKFCESGVFRDSNPFLIREPRNIFWYLPTASWLTEGKKILWFCLGPPFEAIISQMKIPMWKKVSHDVETLFTWEFSLTIRYLLISVLNRIQPSKISKPHHLLLLNVLNEVEKLKVPTSWIGYIYTHWF